MSANDLDNNRELTAAFKRVEDELLRRLRSLEEKLFITPSLLLTPIKQKMKQYFKETRADFFALSNEKKKSLTPQLKTIQKIEHLRIIPGPSALGL